ncbi:MAG: enoyl-CoA hydratase [Granulosicoccaceae bacterium]
MSNTAEQTEHAVLLIDHRDGVYRLTLNRPAKYNALSEEMLSVLQTAIENTPADARAVVIAASGKAFCAGHDLKQMRSNPEQQYYQQLFDQCAHIMKLLIDLPQPVIAQIQGMATAAGCQLVANCDLAIAANTAKFAVSGINVGLFCSVPSVPLSRNLSRKRAFEMLMTGDFISADKAVDWGLLNASVEPDELESTVNTLCDKIKSKPAVTTGLGKDLFYKQLELPLEQAYQHASDAMACNMMEEETSEGIDAFIGKRKPDWS